MVTAAEFWAQKRRAARFDTITFEQPEFATPFRLVANVFAEVSLGGNVYTPAPIQIGPPAQNGEAQPKLSLTFPRATVGRQFKQQLKLIEAAGSREPIAVTYAIWLEDTAAPKVSWPLFVSENGGIRFNREAVQVQASLDNPMLRFGQPIYLPETFTGLVAI